MTEEPSERAGEAAPGILRAVLLWTGGIASLALLGCVLLYIFGDPRPRTVDAAQVGGGPSTLPEMASEAYFRVRAEFIPLPPASETRDPLGKAWVAVFGESVAQAGASDVRVVFELEDSRSVPARSGESVLLTTSGDGPPKSAVTDFFTRRDDSTVRLRLDVVRRKDAAKGALPNLLGLFGPAGIQSSGWISVFSGDRAAGDVLGPDTALLSVRDFTGRAVAAVRIGVEARRSIVFGEEYLGGAGGSAALERLILENPSLASMRAAIQTRVERNLPPGFRDPAYRKTLSAQLDQMFVAGGDADAAADCRAAFAKLYGDLGLSATDSALLAYLAWLGRGGAAASPPTCGDERLHHALAGIGAHATVESAMATIARQEAERREAEAKAKAAEREAAAKDARGRYVCLGTSGGRIEARCRVLNELAAEWRAGTKLLGMDASRRHILEGVGLEEPTLDMTYATGRIENRRQLLIYVALSKVENFACFRLVRRDPDYFETLVLMREDGGRALPRLDVFEFAFNEEGRIARIRRRAAVSQDLDEAMSLPDGSRCRREFLGDRATALKKLIQRQWRLPSTSG